MARRAAPPHRLVVEAELDQIPIRGEENLLDALWLICELLGVDVEQWACDPHLEFVFTTAAAAEMVNRLCAGDPTILRAEAIRVVADRLGVSPKTLDGRLRRLSARDSQVAKGDAA